MDDGGDGDGGGSGGAFATGFDEDGAVDDDAGDDGEGWNGAVIRQRQQRRSGNADIAAPITLPFGNAGGTDHGAFDSGFLSLQLAPLRRGGLPHAATPAGVDVPSSIAAASADQEQAEMSSLSSTRAAAAAVLRITPATRQDKYRYFSPRETKNQRGHKKCNDFAEGTRLHCLDARHNTHDKQSGPTGNNTVCVK